MEERLVPLVNHFGTSAQITTGAHREINPPMVKNDSWLGVLVGNRQQVATPPQIFMASRNF